jgi:tetratricopeptide (TPR) repeat protein
MRRFVILVGGLAVAAGCKTRDYAEMPAVPVYTDLGAFSVPISTENAEAQRYFDQGMRLTYAFNHGEAIRAFGEAARLDPNCAICHWGIALASGPNINWPMDSLSGVAAWEALKNAERFSSHANEREQALIQALGARYAEVPPAQRASLDSAYAKAMAEVAARFPDDHEVATLYAEALMDLRPWAYWEPDGKPAPQTEIILAQLERVIAADSSHPGACHYFIHAVEAVAPERAVPCAERLAQEMPGAGHLVHMPAHIYIRVGRYADAITHNEHATHVDSVFAASERPSMVYAGLYIPHNHHFLGFAALLAGRSALALQAARETVAKAPVAALAVMPDFQGMAAFEHSLLLKFGRFDEVLAKPMPPAELPVARAVAYYSRGTALAATSKGGGDSARALVDSIAALGSGLPAGTAKRVVEIAQHSLAGEIAARSKQWRDAETHFRAAMAIEDQLAYMEPPWWIEPVRHALGAVLLNAGKAREAEKIYREDLVRFPQNGWALYGLWQSLRAQGKPEAAKAEAEFKQAWAGADVQLTASHF